VSAPVLHHITLWVPDLDRAEKSWSWLLGELGYTRDPDIERVALFRHPGGFAVALEQSSDMVPGMLYSRLRPGLNHMAFRLERPGLLQEIVDACLDYGWAVMPIDHHQIAGGADVAYIEDSDGFEVELVAPLEVR
jgi:catechol 2,3-dioxygenase-like lactoylglutathione lyase family enzyme